MKNKKTSLTDFPEEKIIEKNVRMTFFGEASYENQMAVLSHYLHGHRKGILKEDQQEIVDAIRDYLDRKESRQGLCQDRLSDSEILKVAEDPAQYGLFSDFYDVPFPAPDNPEHSFIDLFAGIGGIRIPFDEMGYDCVFSSEWDAKACRSYFANFGTVPFGDITKIPAERIPRHDILLAGFPCQAFSIMGKMQGFADTRGTMLLNAA